jgi:hypothetical protein
MINDPGNAGTAGSRDDWPEPSLTEKPPRRTGPIYPTSAALTAARKAKANAVALGVLTGVAILAGGIGALVVTPAWMPPTVAIIGWAGLSVIVSAINHARFGPAPAGPDSKGVSR